MANQTFSYDEAFPLDKQGGNAFSYEEAFGGEPAPKKQNTSLVGDAATALKQGVLKLPGAATGLADIPAGALGFNRPFSRAAEAVGEAIGFRPGQWAKEANAEYSPQTQAAQKEIDQAWSDPKTNALDVAGAYVRNPRATMLNVVQSLPSVAAGGVLARGLGAAGMALSGPARAAVGEGAVMAGQSMAEIDEQVDPRRAAAAAAGVGVLGGAIGYAGGRVAQRLGIDDVDVLAAGGARATAVPGFGATRRAVTGAAQEGLIEEAPQSALETAAQNWAQERPLTEGMARAVVEGGLAGGVMGGTVGALTRSGRPAEAADDRASEEPQPTAPTQKTLLLENSPPDRLYAFPDGTVGRTGEVESYLAGLPEEQRAEARARLMGQNYTEVNDPQAQQARRWWENYGTDGAQTQPVRDYLAEVQDAIRSGTPYTTQQTVETVRNAMEDAWLAQNVGADPAIAMPAAQAADVAGAQLQEEFDQVGGDAALAAVDARVRTGRILSGLQNILDGGVENSVQALRRLNDGLAKIDDAPLSPEEVSRVRRMLDAYAGLRGAGEPAPLPSLQQPVVDRFADNAAMEALIPERPSKRMGIDPAAGPLSSAAAQAVDGGLSGAMGVRLASPSTGNPLRDAILRIRSEKANGQAQAQTIDAQAAQATAQGSQAPTPVGSDGAAAAPGLPGPGNTAASSPGLTLTPQLTAEPETTTDGTQTAQAQQTEAQGQAQQPTTEIGAQVAAAANEAATSDLNDRPVPTDAQKEAGNNSKGHVKFDGLDLSIENPVGSTRSGVDPNGQAWSVDMVAHYGYMKRTKGADGEQVDVYLANDPKPGSPVYVFDQYNGDGTFDEHKAVAGVASQAEAEAIYDAHFSDGSGPSRRRGVKAMSPAEFKAWASSEDAVRGPVQEQGQVQPGREVSRETGKYKEGFSEFRAQQVRDELAIQNPEVSYTVEEDNSLKNGFVVVGRVQDATGTKQPNSDTPSVPPATAALKTGAKTEKTGTQATETASEAAPKIEDLGEKIGGARKDTARSIGTRTQRPSDTRPAWARRFEISQIASDSRNPDQVGRWIISDTRNLNWLKQPKQVGSSFATRKEAEAAVPLAAVSLKHRAVPMREGQWEIWRDITDRKRVKVVNQSFASREEALAYMAQNAVAILETSTTFGEADLPLSSDLERVGTARRTGDVAGQDFMDTFGFRGVEFGNWNNQDERQQVMNEAYDGLLDLAEVLGLAPSAISLNGDLALAFGARGHGLSGARAHYERQKVVINLTKMNGAGALAHEWFHALDHYFGRQDGKASSRWEMGADGTRSLQGAGVDDMATEGMRGQRSGVRLEIRDALRSVMEVMTRKAETYIEDTQKVDLFVGQSREEVRKELDRLRRDLAQQLDPKYYSRKNAPATAEQLAEFDTLAEQLVQGVGLETSYRPVVGSKSLTGGRWTNDALEKISGIYKAVRGRSGFNAERTGILDRLRGHLGRYEQRLKMLADAQVSTEKTRAVPTNFAMDARSLDQGRGADYWTTPPEMAARAFQGYVEDKIAAKGGKSPFLNHAPESAGILTPWGWKRPYPAGAERKAINAAFDKLVSEFKTKETEQGTAIYSRPIDADLLQRMFQPLAPLSVAETQAAVADMVKAWKNGPRLRVVATPSELPGGAPADARGQYLNGTAYLVASNHRSAGNVQRTLAHEAIAHYGLRQMLGDLEWRRIMANIQKGMERGDAGLIELRDQVRLAYRDESGNFNLSPSQEADEIAARAVEVGFDAAKGEFRTGFEWVKRAYSRIAQFLRNLGFNVQFTHAELQGMLARAQRFLATPAKTGDALVLTAEPQEVGAMARTESTREAYEARIDALFAGGSVSRIGARVLDRSDMLGLLGHPNQPVILAEGKVHQGRDNHPYMTAAVWKKVPDWLENPAAVFESDTVPGRLVFIAPEMVNGAPVRLIVEPNASVAELQVHLLVNAYDAAGRTPWLRWAGNGLTRYIDKKKFPAILTPSGLQLSRVEQEARGTAKILTEKNLSGWRKLADSAVGPSNDRGETTGGQAEVESGDAAFARGAPTDAGSISSAAEMRWETPASTRFDNVVFKLQDKHVDTKRVQEAITSTTGRIADDLNVYLQEELFHGRAASRVKDFTAHELKPLLAQMRTLGLQMSDVEEYLHARHAREANALIAGREPGMPDGGSGMTNQAADDYFRKLAPDHRVRLEQVAAKVDAIIASTRQLYADYGLEDQATVDGWGNMFQHYVPLMREDKDGGMGIGQGFSVKGREVKGRTGSRRKVVDILANIAAQRERVIVRGEKNRVSRALVGLAQANPNPDFWEVRSQPPTERVYDAARDMVVDRPDSMFKQRPNVITAKVRDSSGRVTEQAVVLSEDNERAMRMAQALKNLDAGNLEGLLGSSAQITRYFAAINTQYNPVFGVVNLVRDVQAAMVNLAATPLAGQQLRIATDTAAALSGIYRDVRAARRGDRATSAWSSLWEQLQADGGTTGYRDLFRTSADRAEQMQSILTPEGWMKTGWGRLITADGRLKAPAAMVQKQAGMLFDWLSDYNEAMENGVRLATYKAALDNGMSREQAASLAKNLTVNFNRRGQVGLQAGALYAFFNAAMQGTARIGQTIFDMDNGNPKTMRLSSVGKKVVYGGVLLGSMQALMIAAAGFGDDDPPEFVRERALIIPTGGKTYISIPMPLGLHVIPGLGRHATEFALSGFKKPAQRVAALVAMFADAFNPIGNAGLSIQTIAPTALDPLVALSENRDWTGKPIARVSSNPAMPGHAQWKDTATSWSKLIAEGINAVTGGNKYVAGVLSPTPDQIDYLFAQLTGGVGREISKVDQTVRSMMSGEELPTYKVPLIGRLIGNADSQASQGNAFYANLQRLNELETQIKGLRKDGRSVDVARLVRENPEARLIQLANRTERQVQELRREKRDLIERGAGQDAVRAKEEQITAVMVRLNDSVNRLRE